MLAVSTPSRALRPPLTALIDVVFILLLFFMLSSSFVRERQVEVKAASGGVANTAVPLRLIVRADGHVTVGGNDFALDSAAFAAEIQRWKLADSAIVVSAESDTAVQLLVTVLDRFAAAGLSRFSLAESRPL